MRVRIWGCRGSLAAPGPDTVRYGGNTSCVEVRLEDGTLLILDAGSGLRELGDSLGSRPGHAVHLLLTHLHLDHLQGLAFFAPFWSADAELHVWGPESPTEPLAERVAGYVSPPLFPVHLSNVPSRPTFHDAPEGDWDIGGARITAMKVSHQGPTLGFRIEADGQSVAYIPDHEPSLGVDLARLEPEWISGFGLAAGVDVLLHDSQYTEEEYPSHVGWGHSSVDHVVALACRAQVHQLVLFHHDPSHSDAALDRHLDRARELWGDCGRPPVLAADGMEIDVGAIAGGAGPGKTRRGGTR